MAFAAGAALPARRRARAALSRRRAPLAVAEKPVRATVARTGESVLVSRARSAPASPLVLCPVCHAAFNGAALTSACPVRCSLCAHEFVADPSALYERVSAARPSAARPAAAAAAPKAGEIRCAHFSHCPGCEVSSGADAPPVAPRAAGFLRSLGFRGRWAVAAGPSVRWRTLAKLAVREVKGAPRLGLYRAGSHDVLSVPRCAVHAPEVNLAAAAVLAALAETGATAYVEATGEGMCRYVLFSVQRATRLVQVTLVWNRRSWKDAQPYAQRVGATLWRLHGTTLLHSVWFNWNVSGANAIVSPDRSRFYRMHGAADFEESVLGSPMYFAPYAFRQANLDAFEKLLLPKLLTYIPARSAVAEFCAGVGVIGLAALKQGRVKRLVATEINPAAQELFWKSLRASHPPSGGPRPKVEYVVGSDAETKMLAHDGVDIVIVDPPRAGLSDELVQTLANPPPGSALRRIIYVSCGYDAFRRESAQLVSSGNWKVIGAHGFVLFPGVDHLEILAVFDRPHLPRQEETALEGQETTVEKRKSNTGSSRDAWGSGRARPPPVDTTRRKGTPPPWKGRKQRSTGPKRGR